MSPRKLVKFGSEMTRGEMGMPDGCGTAANQPAPAINATTAMSAIARTGPLIGAFSRRRCEAIQNAARHATQNATSRPNV